MARLVSWVLALLFVIAASTAVVLQTVDKTALNAKYVEAQFRQVKGYKRFALAFSDYVTKQTNQANPQLPQSQDISITVDAAKLRFAAFFDQLQPYLKGKSNNAVLDFGDIIKRSWIPAFPIPFTTATLQPLALPTSPAVQHTLQRTQTLKAVSIIAAVVLAAALLYSCYIRSRYRLFAWAIMVTGLLVAASGFLVSTVFRNLLADIAPSTKVPALTAIMNDVVDRTASGAARQLVVTGIAIIVSGVVIYVVMRIVSKYQRA